MRRPKGRDDKRGLRICKDLGPKTKSTICTGLHIQ